MKRIQAVVCIITTILGFGPGAPSTLLASGPCKQSIWIPTINTSCSCAGFSCPDSWVKVRGHYTCTSPGNESVCEAAYTEVGSKFACSMSYNWPVILACALGGAVCVTTCSTAPMGVGVLPCLACIAAFGSKCVGCSVVVCSAGTVGNPIMDYETIRHEGRCP